MTAYEAIQRRRSIRRYKADEIPEETLNRVLEAARLAPSGCAREARKLIVVRDPDTRMALAKSSPVRFPGPQARLRDAVNTKVAEAPVVIVGCNIVREANMSYHGLPGENYVVFSNRSRKPDEPGYWREYLTHASSHTGNYESMGIWDLATAMDHLSIAAVGEGLGTCWIGIADERAIREILAIPDEVQARMMMLLGYPAENPDPRPRRPLEEVVSFETY